MHTIKFPAINLEFKIDPVAFSIGELEIRWYGIIIAVGFLLALVYAFSRIKNFGLDADRVVDVVLCGAVGALVCARLYYVIFKWSEEYADDPIRALYVWEGGLAIYGGLIGAFVVGAIFCKVRKVKLLPMFDLAGASILLGQAIGRWGNFVNAEAFGTNTNLPWGMTGTTIVNYLTQHKTELEALGITVYPNSPVHPTFLYESLWCILGFVLIGLYIKRRKFDGEIFLMYIAWYSLGRMFIEGLRTDSLMIGTLRVSQILAAILFIAATITILVVRSKIKRNNDPEYLKLYVLTEEAELIRQGVFYKKKGDESAEEPEASEEYIEESTEEDVSEEEPAEEAPEEEDAAEDDAQDEEKQTEE